MLRVINTRVKKIHRDFDQNPPGVLRRRFSWSKNADAFFSHHISDEIQHPRSSRNKFP
jgi:hypothetical protein